MPHFWRLQILFWSGLSVVSLLSVLTWASDPAWGLVGFLLFQAALGLALSYPLHMVFSIVWNSPLRIRLVLSFLAVLIVAGIWNLFRVAVFNSVFEKNAIWSAFGDWYFGGIYVFLCWTALYHGIRYFHLLESENISKLEAEAVVSEEKFKRLHAETETKEAQLKMLRYQLNPHFLFNTLNAINSLVGTQEPERAQKMIVQLSQFLRYSLDNDPEMKIEVRHEIVALTKYLDIEKTRFGERLRLQIDVADDAEKALIPSLLLQPLLENSMKHAIAKSESGGSIALSINKLQNQLHVEVNDSGPGISVSSEKLSNSEGRGIGLRNTIDRLKAFYGARFSFELGTNSWGGLKTIIDIPFELKP